MSHLMALRLLLAAMLVGVLALLLGGCSSSQPQASASSSPETAVSDPTALPFAPPVTPEPGQSFVGYWVDEHPVMSGLPVYYEMLPRAGGYDVSVNGSHPVATPLEDGRLVLQTVRETPTEGGAMVRPGFELSWEDGRCILSTKPSAMTPTVHQPLKRLARTAYVAGVYRLADQETRMSAQNLAIGAELWTERRGQGPLQPSQMRPGSAFDRWLVKLTKPAVWVWPDNPFTGEPMANGPRAGDFTYVASGDKWTMKGHLSNGRSFNARSQ